jgi:Pentose-5-phosphate-3-epimerase
MPRQIQEVKRHGSTWYRIDKADGSIVPVNGVAVVRAAQGTFKKPLDAIMTGRFTTTFAIYSDEFSLRENEKPQAHE